MSHGSVRCLRSRTELHPLRRARDFRSPSLRRVVTVAPRSRCAMRALAFEAEHLEHLFERFYRADPSRTRGSGGSGLGLSIVASIVDAHGGAVSAASEPGRAPPSRSTYRWQARTRRSRLRQMLRGRRSRQPTSSRRPIPTQESRRADRTVGASCRSRPLRSPGSRSSARPRLRDRHRSPSVRQGSS